MCLFFFKLHKVHCTHPQCIYYLVPHIPLGGQELFRRLTSLLFVFMNTFSSRRWDTTVPVGTPYSTRGLCEFTTSCSALVIEALYTLLCCIGQCYNTPRPRKNAISLQTFSNVFPVWTLLVCSGCRIGCPPKTHLRPKSREIWSIEKSNR